MRWQRKCIWRLSKMSANPLDLFTTYAGAPNAPACVYATERRKRARIRVHWPVLLFRTAVPETIASVTIDLSSSGFYCCTDRALEPGEVLRCTIKIPSHDPSGKCLERNLDCRVHVVRVDRTDSGFGVACHIDDYHIAESILKNSRLE